MSLLGRQTQSKNSDLLFGYRVQTSIFGNPVSIVLGRNRVPGDLIWNGDWTQHTVKSGGKNGKGSGGGKGSGQYTYSMSFLLALAQGTAAALPDGSGNGLRAWQDKTLITDNSLLPSFFSGAPGQAPWGFLASNHAGESLGYSERVLAGYANYDLGTAGTVPNNSFEIDGPLGYGSGVVDALVTDVIEFVLTNRNALGFDNSLLGDMTEVRNFCLANGIFISPVIDTQQSAAQYLTEYLMIANAEIVESEGLLKLRSYGDTAASSAYGTFVPSTAPLFDLDYSDFIGTGNPITFSIEPAQDADNSISIEWSNRDREYNFETHPDEDPDAIRKYGRNIGSPVQAHSITTLGVVSKVASIQLKRRVHMLRKVQFTLGWAYSVLEPMDIVSVPEQFPSSDRIAVRLLTIEENDNGDLACTGEVLPYPISAPTVHPKQSAGGYSPGVGADPGATNAPIFFEETSDMQASTLGSALTLLISLSGGPTWGGCSVHVSRDGGASYQYVDRQGSRSTMGTLTAALAFGADPDLTHTLSVDLQASLGALSSVAQVEADAFRSLVVVDDELLAYETATLTGPNAYDLTYLRRGALGTFAVPHGIGARFAALDGSQFEYQYQPNDIGKTLWFKFPAHNRATQREQDLTAAVAYPFTVRAGTTRFPLPLQVIGAVDLNNVAGGIVGYSTGMRLQQVSVQNADPSVSTGIAVSYVPPRNSPSTLVKPPAITGVAVSGGGSIAAGKWLVALSALDANGIETDFTLTTVVVSAGSSQLVVSATWDAGTHGYVLYAGPEIDQLYPADTSFSGGTFTPPATITIADAGAGTLSNQAGPVDTMMDHQEISVFEISHGGDWGDTATSYGTNTITFAAATFTTNQFAGHKLVLYAPAQSSVVPFFPLLKGTILSNTANVVTLDFDPMPFVTAGVLSSGTPTNDVWVCRMKPGSITANSFTDPNLASSYAPTGLAADQDKGNILLAVAGKGAGAIYNRIAGNTGTTVTVEGEFAETPDASTEFLIIKPGALSPPVKTQSVVSDGSSDFVIGTGSIPSPVSAAYANFAPVATVPVPNQNGLSVLIVAQAADADGNLSDFALSPMQEAYLFGQPGNPVAAGPYYAVPIVAGVATPDASKGTNLLILTADTNVAGAINFGPDPTIDIPWDLIVQQDSAGGHSTIFDATYFMNFAIATAASPPKTQCHVSLKTKSTGNSYVAGTPSIDQPIAL